MLLLHRGERYNANFYYHAGMDLDNSFLLKDSGRPILLVSKMNQAYAEEKFKGEVIAYTKDPLKQIEKLARGKKIEMDFHGISASLYQRLSSFSKPKDVSDQLARLRMKKSPGELLLIRRATRISKDLLELAKGAFGRTEQEFSSTLYLKTYSWGLRPSFRPIVSTGANTAFPHSEPTTEKISGFCLVDYGVSANRYYADLTRVFFEKKDRKKEKIYSQLKRIVHQLVDEIPDFPTGGDLARRAEKLYRKERLPFPPHSIGHGIGLQVHELPSLSKTSKDRLEGATFTLEPAVYFPGEFGLRYEEMIHFDGKKAKII